MHKQKRNLLGLDSKERADKTIQLLFSIAEQIFEDDVTFEEQTIDVLFNVIEQTKKQFHKIKEAFEMDDLKEIKKRTREYADLMSILILHQPSVRNIIVNAVLGKG